MNVWVMARSFVGQANWTGLVRPIDMLFGDLNAIRGFLFCNWQINFDEYALMNSSTDQPIALSDAEMKWFGGERTRAVVREALLGYFFDYSPLIRWELDFDMPLSKANNNESCYCTWSGNQAELVALLHAGLGSKYAAQQLRLWIVRYYRSKSLPLSARKCDELRLLVLSSDFAIVSNDDNSSAALTDRVVTDEVQGENIAQNESGEPVAVYSAMYDGSAEGNVDNIAEDPTRTQRDIIVDDLMCHREANLQEGEHDTFIGDVSLDVPQPSEIQLFMQAVTRDLTVIIRGQENARDRYVEDSRGVHVYPLLAVMSRYHPSGNKGYLKDRAGSFLGITTYRVHFHCSVCGCRSPTAHKGYKISLGTRGTELILKIFHISLSLLQLMLQLGGIPNQIAVIADLAIGSMDILETDLRNDLLRISSRKDIKQLRRFFASKSTGNDTAWFTDRAVLFDASQKV